MKASELIEKLQALISEHGDLDVYLKDWSEDYNPPASADSVEYSARRGDKRFVIDHNY